MKINQDETPIPGAAHAVYAGWVWIVDGRELRWTKRPTRPECEAVLMEVCQRLGVESALAD